MCLMAGIPTCELTFDSFYTMFTLRQVQNALGCSRATLYRTLGRAGIVRYYVPNHPGPKYVWACSLLKLIGTPALKKVVKYKKKSFSLTDVEVNLLANRLELTTEQTVMGLECGLIPLIDSESPWWFEKAVKGILLLPLPYK